MIDMKQDVYRFPPLEAARQDWLRIGCGRRERAERRDLETENWLRLRGCQGVESYT